MSKRATDKSQWVLNIYLVFFFGYLFLPLIFMVAAAFNSYSQPSVTQWESFSFKWFVDLFENPNNRRFLSGLWNSILIALGVICLSIPLGLSGALILTKMDSKYRGLLYGMLISPVLVPGIILGISSLIFWRVLGVHAGLIVAILAQSTFIAAYCMLMFMARLQRQDPILEEAALDLGASQIKVFFTITIPFLIPTMITASVIAFLQSFENYNTTIFAIGSEHTLVTEIGSRMRFGLSPVINVIGVIFVALTVIFSTLYVIFKKDKAS